MTPTFFGKIGDALYGTTWRVRVAKQLGVAERTVRRWEKGVSEIPPGINGDLAELCRERAAVLAKLAEQLAA